MRYTFGVSLAGPYRVTNEPQQVDAMVVRSISSTCALGPLMALALAAWAGEAAAATSAAAPLVPGLALCVSPAILFGIAVSAPMAMLLLGFIAVILTDRAR